MDARITTVMVELRNKLKVLYGRRLKGVYLYGSHARGHASRESDLDVLIVLDEIPHYSLEVSRTSALISSLSLSSGVTISRVFMPEHEWSHGTTAFVVNAREEAIPA